MRRELTNMIACMKEKNIDLYIILTCDYHDSEYVGDYFGFRKYISGFTGSAGTLIVTQKEGYLFTDGRYFIQAEHQLKDSGIHLMKMGEKGVPDIQDFIGMQLQKGSTFACDGRCISYAMGKELQQLARRKQARFLISEDVRGDVWKECPKQEFKPVWLLKESEAGESRQEKIQKIRAVMERSNTQFHIMNTLDDIAWLYNMRGDDVPCNPVFYSYTILSKEQAILYMNLSSLKQEDRIALEKDGIEVREYAQVYEDIKKIKNMRILVEKKRINAMLGNMSEQDNILIDHQNPSTYFKSIKNKTEIENTKQVHIEDGVAVTKFMRYIKENSLKKEIHEEDAAKYLDNLRSQIKDYIELSFDTISAFGANGAMMHYNAEEGNNAKLEAGSFLLVDSGGQYKRGTTDITRTFAIGELSHQQKKDFTLVAKAMLRLMNTRFLEGCSGINLDIMARGVLWQEGIDYKCGTGHGVGHILNVHEGPNAFRWKIRQNDVVVALKEGMITTDEPGVYREGEYGIRTENELLCTKWTENGDGTFLQFEPITFAPIDLDGIDTTYLNEEDISELNAYHRQVYEKLSPYFEGEDLEFLKKYTREVQK